MIQFLKNIWYAQRNAEKVNYLSSMRLHVYYLRGALNEIALSNPKNTNGTVRKHVRIARDALGWRR